MKMTSLKRIGLAFVAFLGSLVVFLFVEFPHGPQHGSYDFIVSWLSKREKVQNSDIAIVKITPTTLDGYPYLSPIDRNLLADLIETIDRAEPKAVGLDLIFDRSTEEQKDKRLLHVLTHMKSPVVLGVVRPDFLLATQREFQGNFTQKIGKATGHLHVGEVHTNPFAITDSIVRSIVTFERPDTPHLGLAQALVKLTNKSDLRNGDRDYISWINPPADGSETFLTLPAESLIGAISLDSGRLATLLRGKYVLIGGAFPDRDHYLTPLSVGGSRFPGVEIHAQILRQELHGVHLYAFDGLWWTLALALPAGLLGLWIAIRGFAPNHHQMRELLVALVFVILSALVFRLDIVLPYLGMFMSFSAGFAAGHVLLAASGEHAKRSS